jgi:cytochrome P450
VEVRLEDDLLGEEAIRDPYGYFGRLRDREPVAWNERYRSWVITSHEHCSVAFKDPRFSSDRISPFIESKLSGPDVDPQLRATFDVLSDWLVFKDPPDHTRLRRLVHRAFTPRAVERMRTRVDALADELLDDVVADGEADLIRSFAYPLPAIVIAEMLGVPAEDRDRFKHWSDQITALVFGGLEDPDRYKRAALGMQELAGYLAWLIKRYEAAPEENLISALIHAREQDDALSEDEVVATCTLLLFGGHETTTNLIANAVVALLDHPTQLAALRDGTVETREAIEEFTRYDGPAKVVVRQVGEDLELGGRRLAGGQRVFLVPASANRDPGAFPAPDVLDLGRERNVHLGFGVGIHYCLGAPLARLEGAIAIPKVLHRLADLELAADEVQWLPVLLTRGLEELPVRFTATAPRGG